MALRDSFESTQASMLHQTPLPTVEIAAAELISKGNRKFIMKMPSNDFTMAVVQKSFSQTQSCSNNLFYNYCKKACGC